MKIQKRHIVLAALVLALGTAVYINWQLSGSSPSTTSKELGAASYVNATVSNTATDDEAVETAALSKAQKNFFATERTKRQNTQDKIIDEANEVFELESSSDEDKSNAQQSIEKMLKTFTIQDSIESIIKAKGFSESLCYISDEGVTVIVPDTELNDTAALVIDDAVTTHYQVGYDSISIVGAN
ncbi:MAG: SpoIIIAH-like family protein [Ruminococcus sp.]|nr:SpoIIIAH-like family protein [Ruminococcus sp.]